MSWSSLDATRGKALEAQTAANQATRDHFVARQQENLLKQIALEDSTAGEVARRLLAAKQGSEALDKIANSVLSRIQLNSGNGIQCSGTNGAWTISVANDKKLTHQKKQKEMTHPFQVVFSADYPGYADVEKGILWRTLKDQFPIEPAKPMAPLVGDIIYLEIEIKSKDELVPKEKGVSIYYGKPWAKYPDPVELAEDEDGSVYQTKYFQLIAYCVANNYPVEGLTLLNGTKVIQVIKTDLKCTLQVVNGIVCLIPEPAYL